MVSEGMDIPRLRVGVYATNVVTDLFFRQAVGRFVRVIPDLGPQPAYFFITGEDALITLAKDIKEERDHEANNALYEEPERLREEVEDIERQPSPSLFIPGNSSEAVHAMTVYEDGVATPEQISVARKFRMSHPGLRSVSDEQVLFSLSVLQSQRC